MSLLELAPWRKDKGQPKMATNGYHHRPLAAFAAASFVVAAVLTSPAATVDVGARQAAVATAQAAEHSGFRASVSSLVSPGETITGRLLFFFSDSCDPEPRFADPTTDPEPVIGIDIIAAPADEPLDITFDDLESRSSAAYGFDTPRNPIDPNLCVQAVLDLDTFRRSFNAPGNLYSDPYRVGETLNDGWVSVVINHVVPPRRIPRSAWIRPVEVRSALLSDFHGRDIYLRAAVVLPAADYDANDPVHNRFPRVAVYRIPGLYGRHINAWDWLDRHEDWRRGRWPLDALLVFLDPDVPLGHSTFANSANNGPVADALIEELIPYIENRFLSGPQPITRFLTGHSSGGWTSIWLQLSYPDFFDGAWSTAPDSVDFRAFQLIDLYADANAYYDDVGNERPSVRRNGDVVLSIFEENQWELATGTGNQWSSWFAVFGRRNPVDGGPAPLWNRLTGVIDRAELDHWRGYDIRLQLAERWDTLAPDILGKIHIVGGDEDNYYLEGALEYLQEFLVETGTGEREDAGTVRLPDGGYVTILRDEDHSSFLGPELTRTLHAEMAQRLAELQR